VTKKEKMQKEEKEEDEEEDDDEEEEDEEEDEEEEDEEEEDELVFNSHLWDKGKMLVHCSMIRYQFSKSRMKMTVKY
jgi:ABC-type Zn2+ transport system substrate-binding protein/surface adhesin